MKQPARLPGLRRLVCLCLVVCLVLLTPLCLASCAIPMQAHVFYSYFDTVCEVRAKSETAGNFDRRLAQIETMLEHYHRLFDIYYEYTGINNLCTVNRRAGEPVQVPRELYEFLCLCVEYAAVTEGQTNIAIGAVSRLWHTARYADSPYVPAAAELAEALTHTDLSRMVLDPATYTVTLTDPAMSLDVGAIGKGYAARRVAEYLEADGASGYALSFGGNVCIIGAEAWPVDIKNPAYTSGADASPILGTLSLSEASLVTSGAYERYMEVDGVRYGHVLDPHTGRPAALHAAVCVLGADSGLCDALSTALFVVPVEQGKALARRAGVEVLWVGLDGGMDATDGFPPWEQP